MVKELAIERSVADNSFTREIVDRAGLPARIVDQRDFAALVAGDYPDNLGAGKRLLLLSRNNGEFLKKCPSTKGYRCCDYQIINTGTGCPMDCVYCILQAYLNTPYLNFFVNSDDMFAELGCKLDSDENRFWRIGTGEFTDSMALDRITGLSSKLVPFFAGQKNAILELKTKSAWVENLARLDHNGRTITAWSLNSPAIAKTEERQTASLEQRLIAAAKCASWGYPLAFHFDPIIDHEDWRDGYRETIRRLFSAVPSSSIRWISLGALRFIPKLGQLGSQRFPRSAIFYHEFVPGIDTKQRYFKSLRISLYRVLYEELQRWCDPRTCIYFCMESDEVWTAVMGFKPSSYGGLPVMLDRAARW